MNLFKASRRGVWPIAFVTLLLVLALVGVACGPADPSGDDDGATAEVRATDANNDSVEESSPAETTTGGLDVDTSTAATDAEGLPVGFTSDGHAYRGNPNAPVVIEEFSDFQCPFCARFAEQTLPSLEANQVAKGEAVIVYFDFPLERIHPQASAAANAARCAGDQGATAFWAMHDALFSNPAEWSNANANEVFGNYAENIGLDVEAFNTCVQSAAHTDAIQADLNAGIERGVTGTPSFFINGQLMVGAQPAVAFNNAIVTVQEGGQLGGGSSGTSTTAEQRSQPAVAPTPAAFSDDQAATLGDPAAPVTIVEFTDYQCPYCQQHATQTMPQIIQQMVEAGRVYYVIKDFPLDQLHPDARAAAVAVRCAGDQDAYWEMHDAVFNNQSEWGGRGAGANEVFAEYAADLGLDTDNFAACLDNGKYDEAIQANVSEGRSLGVSGTPFFFVDGYPLNGARPYEHFEIAVRLAEEGRLAEAFTPQQPPPQQQAAQPQQPVDVPIGDAYSIGDPNAPITIVEYTDYQCPFCGRHFNQTYPQLIEQYVEVGTVRYVFKDFPLTSIHPQALEAAEAARCAGDQGAFLEMHDVLFERQQQWSGQNPTTLFTDYAEELGLDTAAFGQCLSSHKHQAAIMADLQEGASLGVTGTPGFFVNGHLVSGAQPFAQFEQIIEQLLAEPES